MTKVAFYGNWTDSSFRRVISLLLFWDRWAGFVMLCGGRVSPVMIRVRGLDSFVISLNLVIASGGIVGAVMMARLVPLPPTPFCFH